MRAFRSNFRMLDANAQIPAGPGDNGPENAPAKNGQQFHFISQQCQVMSDVASYPAPGNPNAPGIGIPNLESLGRRSRNVHIGPADDTNLHMLAL